MRKSVIAMWFSALSSSIEFEDKIANEPGAPLRNGEVYSPLGILCELHRRYTSKGAWDGNVYRGYMQSLPPAVKDWAGMTEEESSYFAGRGVRAISAWLSSTRDQDALMKRKTFQLELPMLHSSYAF